LFDAFFGGRPSNFASISTDRSSAAHAAIVRQPPLNTGEEQQKPVQSRPRRPTRSSPLGPKNTASDFRAVLCIPPVLMKRHLRLFALTREYRFAERACDLSWYSADVRPSDNTSSRDACGAWLGDFFGRGDSPVAMDGAKQNPGSRSASIAVPDFAFAPSANDSPNHNPRLRPQPLEPRRIAHFVIDRTPRSAKIKGARIRPAMRGGDAW